MKQERNLLSKQVETILSGAKNYANNLKSTAYIFLICDKNYYSFVYQEDAEMLMDNRLNIIVVRHDFLQ